MIYLILTLLLTHFIFDFLLQSDKLAINKSSSNYYLSIHVLIYSAGLFFWAFNHHALFSNNDIYKWALLNGVLHWITDYFTSRLNAYLWKKEMRHWFFVAIGADQLIHYFCLFISYGEIIGY